MTRDAAKAAIRRAARERRRAVSAQRDASSDGERLARGVLALTDALGLRTGTTVASYESVAAEPPTAAANAALAARGIRVLVPVTEPDLDLDWTDLTDDARGPLGRGAVGSAGLVIAPGLTVDRSGTRMGQGGGSYDRALPRRRSGVPVVVLLHPGEFVPDDAPPLPRAPHDVPVDAVLTVDGLTPLAPASGGGVSR
ncbi:MAG: 5-formyltetrahydrofolate cyclo-ligase [Dermatophilaceae bacterium]